MMRRGREVEEKCRAIPFWDCLEDLHKLSQDLVQSCVLHLSAMLDTGSWVTRLLAPALSSLQWQLLVGRWTSPQLARMDTGRARRLPVTGSEPTHRLCGLGHLLFGIALHSSESCLLWPRHVARHACSQTEVPRTARSQTWLCLSSCNPVDLASSRCWSIGLLLPHGLLVLVDTRLPVTRFGFGTHPTALQHRSTPTTTPWSSEDVLYASYTRYAAIAASHHPPT